MATNDTILRRVVVVAHAPLGLHVRPATAFVKTARRFHCTVAVFRGEKRANGLSPFDLLSLVAEPGTELVLEVEGADAEAALEALTAVLCSPGTADAVPPGH